MPDPTSPSDFEAAAAVANALKELPKPRQELVLRWVAESLGISAPAAPAPAPALPSPPAPPERHHTTPPTPSPHPVDIASFVATKQPKTDIQFVTVAAYYYRFLAPEADRLNHITVDAAQNATRLADRDRLVNPGSTLNNAKNQGYLDRVGPGKYAINTVGENLVARNLPSSAEPTKGNGKKGARKKNTGIKKKPTRNK